ncbi:MAG: insulinase family protein [Marinobacter sp.]|uniref:insulinase family protein n=1 Tax=Marinobacter sp. TaxID=50741 RepID=UPI00299E1EF4|nr:insulinase family protein [Marinobacter sp.]MDX1754742.1 insulinase family protein [Marinobacter sp.]
MPRDPISAAVVAALVTLLALLPALGHADTAPEPVKSANDHHEYRFLTLDNNLRVLLVSAPESEKAAASLNVTVGSGDDPRGREGLAHFLEHMLFLGTEKYPEPGEYQQFIKSHGGSHNAFTAFQDTNYFFDIQAQHLEPALDRFAQQFSAPLFTADLVERERRAVHSEFSSKIQEDGRRFYDAKKAAFNPEHPYTQFAVGNLTTLEDTEATPLRPDLVQFWQEHYSANRMTLVVYGPQSLDRLAAMVRPRFSAIDNRDLADEPIATPLMTDGQLPRQIEVAALRDIRSLNLMFPIPSQQPQYRTKPANYVSNLLGHEGPGSLFDVLKTQGWVEVLSAGTNTDTGQEAILEIAMELTPEGLANRERIIRLTFAYIDKIRNEGISRERFQEMRQLAEIGFRFQEQQQPVHKVMRLAMQMSRVAPEDVLRAPWMMEAYDPQGYRAVLDRLTPDNVVIAELSQRLSGEGHPRRPWYDTSYRITQLSPEQLAMAPEAALAGQLALPSANPFIPEQLELVSGPTMAKPVPLGTQNGLATWYARDTRFDTPKANIYLSLRSPVARATARNQVLASLLVDTLKTNVNAYAYPARLAGLNYKIYPHLRGITIRVGGYSDKLHVLLTRILSQFARPTLTEQRFEIARNNLLDRLRNKAQARPVEQTGEFVQTTLLEGAWSTDAKIQAAESVQFEDLQRFAREFRAQLDPVMLSHGNLTEASTLNIAQQLNAYLLDQSQHVSVPRSGVRELPAGETRVRLEVHHPDTGYTLYLQGRNTGFAERARYRLLAQLIGAPFYEEIRTRRQMGYIVYATSFEMLETPAIGLVVQSPEQGGSDIDAAVQDFAADMAGRLAELSATELEREKQAVISHLLEQDRQLSDASERYWREIDRNNPRFDSRERLADAVARVTRENLLDVFQRALVDRSQALRVTTSAEPQDNERIVNTLSERQVVPNS